MPTIGMPKIKIEFESMGLTAIQRSERGIVLLILKEDTIVDKTSYLFTHLGDLIELKDNFSEEVFKLIKLAFEASPFKMKVELYGGTGEGAKKRTLPSLLNDLVLDRFNYYACPNGSKEDIKTIVSWHKAQFNEKDSTRKLVVFNETAPDHETIINWCTDNIVYEDEPFSGQDFTALVASDLAALPLTRSYTYFAYPKISLADLPFAKDEDKAVNDGKLFLTWDGENYKVARAVNSLTTYHEDKGEDFSKIRVIEGMHLIKDDIRDTFNKFYVGKILNKYENKVQFIALINHVYFPTISDTVLEIEGNSRVWIDMEENRKYAITRGADVVNMTDEQIKTYNTGSNVFLAGTVSLLDAMEDLFIKLRNQ